MMSLKSYVTNQVTSELLRKTITLLPSISGSLKTTEIDEITKSVISAHPTLQFADNNDIGLCITRILSEINTMPATEGASADAHYASVRESEPLTCELMQIVSTGIATRLSGTLYDLRHTLPHQAKDLSAKILAKLPKEATEDLPPLQYFNWGKLGNSAYRESAMLFAQDRLKCFLRGTVTSYDTDKILNSFPYGGLESVAMTDVVQPLLVKALTDVTPYASDQKFIIGLLTSKPIFMKWAAESKEKLRQGPIGAAVVDVTETIDTITDRLHKIDTEMLSSLGADVGTVSATILTNMQTVLSNIQLLRAAMLHYKENVLVNRLLLTPQFIQSDPFEAFKTDGGTEDMVREYVAYLRLSPHIQFQSNGITAETITAAHPKARAMVTEKAENLRSMTAARRAHALQESIMHCLDAHYHENNPPAQRKNRHLHEQARNRAVASIRSKPIETIAVEYLVSLRTDPLVPKLFEPINKQLIVVASTEDAITNTHIAQATCTAVLSFILGDMVAKFAPKTAV